MSSSLGFTKLIFCLGLLGLALAQVHAQRQAFGDLDVEESKSTADILRLRGYLADEFYVDTTTGYRLRLTRGRNPLIDGGRLQDRDPVLFVHGILSASRIFVSNSLGVEPKDFTNVSLTETEPSELERLLVDEPSAKSLALLALNFGHEVWLLDRRGVPGSQQFASSGRAAGPAGVSSVVQQVELSLDANFWNYSLDDQALVDFPQVVDFVLDRSPASARVSVVGHSAGGALTLMALSLQPTSLTRKVSSCILWAPSYFLGTNNTQFATIETIFRPIMESIKAPVPPPPVSSALQATLRTLCSTRAVQTAVCETLLDQLYGQSGSQQPATQQLVSSIFFPTSSPELAQIAQIINHDNYMHRYDFGPYGNRRQYAQPDAPPYDLSVLANFTSLSFYVGDTDGAVTPGDIVNTRQQLSGPSQYHRIRASFNHVGYFSHVDAPRLAIIPSMRELETLARGVA